MGVGCRLVAGGCWWDVWDVVVVGCRCACVMGGGGGRVMICCMMCTLWCWGDGGCGVVENVGGTW